MTGILNLPGLNELGMKELDAEYHVKAEPAAVSRLCPHCGELHRVQKHGSRSMFIRDLPTHGKTMMIHLDVPRLICLACRKTFMAVVAEVDADWVRIVIEGEGLEGYVARRFLTSEAP